LLPKEADMDAYYNAVWISDTHLCSRGCRVEELLRFIRRVRCRHLYLLGDIVDLWLFKQRRHWTQDINNVIRSLLGQTKHGTQVIYIPGNHDEGMQHFAGASFGNIQLYAHAMHTALDGSRMLVMHGHEFDPALHRKWLAVLGAAVHDYMVSGEALINRLLRWLHLPLLKLSMPLKRRVENAVTLIDEFEAEAVAYAREQGADGIICGHTHVPAVKQIDGIRYVNAGDWVERCTAVAETTDGEFKLIHWLDEPDDLHHPLLDEAEGILDRELLLVP
jgi:UDP-2,3-diacylglucosamine pyrophosphatase LpxH